MTTLVAPTCSQFLSVGQVLLRIIFNLCSSLVSLNSQKLPCLFDYFSLRIQQLSRSTNLGSFDSVSLKGGLTINDSNEQTSFANAIFVLHNQGLMQTSVLNIVIVPKTQEHLNVTAYTHSASKHIKWHLSCNSANQSELSIA